jgi:hypothetical protein
MIRRLRMLWQRLRQAAANPGQFAGGSGPREPGGLQAFEAEELNRLRDRGPADDE